MTDPTERKPTRLRMLAALPLELVQWLCIALLAVVGYTRRAVFWAELSFMRHAYYYGVVRLKRRILGVPAWQPHDVKIGIVRRHRKTSRVTVPQEVLDQSERYDRLREFANDAELHGFAKSVVDAVEAQPDHAEFLRYARLAAALLLLREYVAVTDKFFPHRVDLAS